MIHLVSVETALMNNLLVLLSLRSQHDSGMTSMYILFAVQHLHFPAGLQFQETR